MPATEAEKIPAALWALVRNLLAVAELNKAAKYLVKSLDEEVGFLGFFEIFWGVFSCLRLLSPARAAPIDRGNDRSAHNVHCALS